MPNDNPVFAQYYADAYPAGNTPGYVPVQSLHRYGSVDWVVDLTPFAFDGATQRFDYGVASIEMCNFAGDRADRTPYSSPSAGAALAVIALPYGAGTQVKIWLVHEAFGFLSRGATIRVVATVYDYDLGCRRTICDTQMQIPAGYAREVLASLVGSGWRVAAPPTGSVFHAGAIFRTLATETGSTTTGEIQMSVDVSPSRFSWDA